MIFVNNIALFLSFIIARIDYSYLKNEKKENEQEENDNIEIKE